MIMSFYSGIYSRKPPKVTITRQMLKCVLMGLERNYPRLYKISPFGHATYATVNKEVTGMERFSEELRKVIKVFRIQFPQARLQVFCLLKYQQTLFPIRDGQKITKDPFTSKLVNGYQITFLSKFLLFNSTSSLSESRRINIYDQEVHKNYTNLQ